MASFRRALQSDGPRARPPATRYGFWCATGPGAIGPISKRAFLPGKSFKLKALVNRGQRTYTWCEFCPRRRPVAAGWARRTAEQAMAERSFKEEVQKLKLGAGEEFRGEGILAITKALLGIWRLLCGRLSGRADLAPDGRAERRQRHSRRARCAFRIERQRSGGGRDARGLGQLPAARRRHLQGPGRDQRRIRCARQSLFRRCHRRGADHRRRGLRRRLLDHAGAQPRLRDEVADLAARPAAQPAVHRRPPSKRASSSRRRRTPR